MLKLLTRLKHQAIGMLVILHDLNLAMRHADRVLLLQEGRALSCAAPRQALTPEMLQSVYGLPVRRIQAGDDIPVIVAG
jgi:iron complex transport system ATP-binding protein